MSVQTQIDGISGNVSAALAAIAEKGVTVPDGSNSDALAELIASIQAGGGGNIATGSFTVGDDIKSNIEIAHNLGEKPYFVGVFASDSLEGSYSSSSPKRLTFMYFIKISDSLYGSRRNVGKSIPYQDKRLFIWF